MQVHTYCILSRGLLIQFSIDKLIGQRLNKSLKLIFLDFFLKSLVSIMHYWGGYICWKIYSFQKVPIIFHREGPDFLQHTVKDARAFHRQNSFCSVSGQLEWVVNSFSGLNNARTTYELVNSVHQFCITLSSSGFFKETSSKKVWSVYHVGYMCARVKKQ